MKARSISSMFTVFLFLLSACQTTGRGADPAKMAEIDRDVDNALARLYEHTPSARHLAKRARGILVFPNVVKAGFIGGAEYGKGAMRQNGRTTGYYNLVAGSYGLQAGIQSFDYALFFMNNKALEHLDRTEGLEVGLGPSIVVMDEGMGKSVTNSTLTEDIYAFVYGQRGLMAGLGLKGSKITRINP